MVPSLVCVISWIALNALRLRHFPLLCLFLMGLHVLSLGRTPCTSVSLSLSVDTMDAPFLNKPFLSWLTVGANRSSFSCFVEQTRPTDGQRFSFHAGSTHIATSHMTRSWFQSLGPGHVSPVDYHTLNTRAHDIGRQRSIVTKPAWSNHRRSKHTT